LMGPSSKRLCSAKGTLTLAKLGRQRAGQRYQPHADARREGQVQAEKYEENHVGGGSARTEGPPRSNPNLGMRYPNRNKQAPTNAQAKTSNDPRADPLTKASSAPASTPAPKPNKKGAISVLCNRMGGA